MGCAHGKCCVCQPLTDEEAGDGRENGLQETSVTHRLGDISIENSVLSATIPSHNLRLEYAFFTQRGHYPDSLDRENQDSLCIKTQLQGSPNLHFFGVFDGHGQFGTECSNFVKDKLVEILVADSNLSQDPINTYRLAFLATNAELRESEIDDSMSGTTAITVLVSGDMLYVANVGDSRAVAAVWSGGSVISDDLSCDQTPFRKDEYERVKRCGARVLSVDQVEGVKDPNIQNWGDEEDDEGDPPRLWVENGMYPGTAFTRSVGDSTAEEIGVTAEPEILTVKISPDHLFFVIASDGVFEFLSSQAVVDMVAKYNDPHDACSAVAAESYKLWLENENRTDDITIIVVHIKDSCNSGAAATNVDDINIKQSLLASDRGTPERHVFPSSLCTIRQGDRPLDGLSQRSPLSVAPTNGSSSFMVFVSC